MKLFKFIMLISLFWTSSAHAIMMSKVGYITVPASTGTQSITGLNFEPKIVIFYGNALSTSAGINKRPASMFYGVMSSSAQWVFHIGGNNGVTIDTTRNYHSTTSCIAAYDYVTKKFEADYDSLDSDGFTIEWTTVTSGLLINYVAYGGDDITEVDVGTFTTAGAGLTNTINLGYSLASSGNIVNFVGTYQSSTGLQAPDPAGLCVGWYDGTAQHSSAMSMGYNAGVTARARGAQRPFAMCRTKKTTSYLSTGTAASASTPGDSANGVKITWGGSNIGAGRCGYWAIRGGQWAVDNWNFPASGGSDPV